MMYEEEKQEDIEFRVDGYMVKPVVFSCGEGHMREVFVKKEV
jgi:hypothetical protein